MSMTAITSTGTLISAPVASLDFFSPDTTFVGAGLSRDPAELFDEVFGLLLATNEDARSTLDQIEAETGIAVRDDLLASLRRLAGEDAVRLSYRGAAD